MAISQRRNDRPAAAGPQRQWRMAAERSCCLARNAAVWRQGKKIANKPLQAKVGERRERIVARDPPAKGQYGRRFSAGVTREHWLRGTIPSGRRDATVAARLDAQWSDLSAVTRRRRRLLLPQRLVYGSAGADDSPIDARHQ